VRVPRPVVLRAVAGPALIAFLAGASVASAAPPSSAVLPTVAWVQQDGGDVDGGLFVRAGDGAPRRLSPLPASARDTPFTLGFTDARVSPDGRWVAFGRLPASLAGNARPTLLLADAATGATRDLGPGGWTLTWSADSRFLATSDGAGVSRCAVATGRCARWRRLGGGADVVSGSEAVRYSGVVLSPDGSHMAFVEHPGGSQDPSRATVLDVRRRVVRTLRPPREDLLEEAVGWTQTGPLFTGVGAAEEGTLLRPATTRSSRLRVAARGDGDRDVGEPPTVLAVTRSGCRSIGDRIDGDAGALDVQVQVADLRRGGVRVLARGEGAAAAGISPDGTRVSYSPDGQRIVLRDLATGRQQTLVGVSVPRAPIGSALEESTGPWIVLPSAGWPTG
jgi:hypothetical protein